MPSLKLFISSV